MEKSMAVWILSIPFSLQPRKVKMSDRPILTIMQTLFSYPLNKSYVGSGNLCWTKAETQVFNREVGRFKKIFLYTFADHSSTELFLLKCHLLDHIVEPLHRLGALSNFDRYLFELHNVQTMRSHCRSSRRMRKGMEQTFKGLLLFDKANYGLKKYTGSQYCSQMEDRRPMNGFDC